MKQIIKQIMIRNILKIGISYVIYCRTRMLYIAELKSFFPTSKERF